MKMDDDPGGFCCEHSDRHFGRPFYQRSNGASSHKGGSGKYADRGPVLLLNHLYRSQRVLYDPCNVGRGGRLLHNCGA
jgi:hypothetical protein